MERKTAAVVLAAGSGSRMHSRVRKQYLMLGGRPVLSYSLAAFERSFVDQVVLVTGAGEEAYCRREIVEAGGFTKVRAIVAGGQERYHSVACGLRALPDCDYVFIHDGARPFLSQEILRRTYEAAVRDGACVAAMPVKDTIVLADGEGSIGETPKRDRVWQVQTPQVFAFAPIRAAYERLLREEPVWKAQGLSVTDDAMVARRFGGMKVSLAEGSYRNIKLTTPEDLTFAAALLDGMEW